MSWLASMLTSEGSVSSKRVITLLSFLVCAWGFVADTLGYKVDPKLFDSMVYIVIAGLGVTASEKFANK